MIIVDHTPKPYSIILKAPYSQTGAQAQFWAQRPAASARMRARGFESQGLEHCRA